VIPFEVVTLKSLFLGAACGVNFRAAREIRRQIALMGIRAVVASDCLALLLLMPSLLSMPLKVFYSVIFFYEPARILLLNLLAIPFVDHIAVLSEAMRIDLARRSIGLARKTSVIYWGVDTARFHQRSPEERAAIRASLGLPHERIIIGLVGRYETWKGHMEFLDAAERLCAERSDVTVMLVGGAMTASTIPDVAAYHARVKERIAAFAPRTSLIVWDHRDDVPEIMSSLDLVVCPSEREPYGLVVLEALACGVPVVASSTVGALEVVGEENGVFVSEPRDAESLLEAMKTAISRPIGGSEASKSSKTVAKWPLWRDYSVLVEAKIGA
jgi:mannosyltransferase